MFLNLVRLMISQLKSKLKSKLSVIAALVGQSSLKTLFNNNNLAKRTAAQVLKYYKLLPLYYSLSKFYFTEKQQT